MKFPCNRCLYKSDDFFETRDSEQCKECKIVAGVPTNWKNDGTYTNDDLLNDMLPEDKAAFFSHAFFNGAPIPKMEEWLNSLAKEVL